MADNAADNGPPQGSLGSGGGFEQFYHHDNYGDFSNDGGGGGGGGPWRGNRGAWRGRGGGRGGPFDNGFGHRGMQPPRFRGGRGGFMGQGNMRGAGPRGPPGFMGNRGGKFRQPGPHGDNWSNSGPPPNHGQMGNMGPGGDIGGGGSSDENVWAEAKTPDGKSYFYHTETRETTWERPMGPGVRIIRHEEVGSVPMKMGGPVNLNSKPENFPQDSEATGQGNDNGKMLNSPNPTNNNQNPPPNHPMNQDVASQGAFAIPHGPFSDQMPPAQQQLQGPGNPLQGPHVPLDGNDGARLPIIPPGGVPPTRPNVPFGMPPQFRPPGPMFTNPGADGPVPLPGADGKPPLDVLPPRMPQLPPQPHPGGFAGFPPVAAPPQFVMQPPPMFPQTMPFPSTWGPLGGMSAPTGVPPPLFNIEATLPGIDPKVVAKAYEWSEHISPDGKTYFYNTKTNMSVWEKPPAILEFEEMQKSAANRANVGKDKSSDKGELTVSDGSKAKEMKKSDSKKAEKCRPISSTPVSGTPWCVVWTGDKRVFFFNPSTKQSVWDRPKDLVGRADVDELVRNCPDKSEVKVKKVEATSTTSPQSEPEKVSVNTTESTKEEVPEQKTTVMETEIEDEDPPAKKLKREERNEAEESEKSNNEEEDNDIEEIKQEEKPKSENKDSLREVNASEAEARAAKERANHPLEVRLKQFRDMLIEKQVSAFSTWEKELHKIVFDPRYLLLTSKERKAAFDNYVKERAEEERKEKKTRMKLVKEHFMKFLDEVLSHQYPRLTYNEFVQRYGRDERFKAVEKSRDRESYFLEFISEMKRREKEEKVHGKEKSKDQFLDYLKDKVFDYHLKWTDMRKKFEHDSRFSMLDSEEKEDLFRIHQKRLKAEAKARKKRKKAKNKERAKKLKERSHREPSEENESENGAHSSKAAVKSDGEDSKSEKMEDISEEEEGCITDDSEEDSRERERKEREAASMREREKEVQRALASHLRDREKEREHYRHEEAVQEFQALLTDLVRTSDVTWKDVKKAAKRDGRWDAVAILPKEEMEDLFLQHCEHISRKKKQRFRELLEEAGVKINSTWKEIRKKIKDDPRYVKFSSSERKCEREFDLYLKDKTSTMKTEFRELLKETKTLNYRTKQQISENPHMMKDIEALLGKDKRYLIMDSMPGERHRLLVEYLDDLERKGAPPPPTASEPSRRMKM